ncbi:ER membrane protein complex subunit 2-like [Orbicella faveolata]|uniref:ER membrane protein complex subunit 2-like n=1 Tax=Orbicella faveolata TaxID=48498 RepID=UPI0009E31A41|nr:ER membrane protein complex subunit 2-like [Orbicella faveolata]XP_020600894.1 ER membrane protein complex subunit 2-like [Orbicella faveolata]
MADEVVDLEVARQKMRQWRDEPLRNSEEVTELGECLILEHGNKLGDELWTIYEQVFLASIDCRKMDLATMCLRELKTQFPKSIRVEKLNAMRLEAFEKYEEAEQIYNKILEAEPANAVVRKRLVAILKAQNRVGEAIKELNEYLKKFMSDQEAWTELAELYISQQDHKKAKFCMEELILMNPHNHLFHQRYAEILYTLGGNENMEKARKYFAQALKLDNNNMRALFGFFLASAHLANSSKDVKTKKENSKFATWAATQVNERYQSVSQAQEEDNLSELENMLESLQVAIPQNIPSQRLSEN